MTLVGARAREDPLADFRARGYMISAAIPCHIVHPKRVSSLPRKADLCDGETV